jgi:hypothetical protein
MTTADSRPELPTQTDMTEKEKNPQTSPRPSSRSGSAAATESRGAYGGDGPGKFWVGWFDPRALAILGLAVVALACIAAIIALWAHNNPPPVAITQPAAGATLNAGGPGNIEGSAAPGALVKVYDGATLLGETRADSAGRWVLAIPANLAAGTRTIRVDASDSANRITSASLPLTIAGQAAAALPALAKPAITGPAAGATFVAGQQVNFAGTATPGSTVRLFAADGRVLGTTIANAEGKWNLAIPAAVGLGAILARVTGPDGVNLDSAPLALNFNPAATAVPPTPAPIAPVFGVLPGIFSPGNALKDAPAGIKGPAYENVAELSGSAGPNAKVRIYDGDKLIGETTADAKGNWTYKFTSPLAAGPHSFTAASVDGANEGPRSVAQAFTIVPAQVAAAAATKTPDAAAVKPAFLGPAAGASFAVGQPIDFSGTAAPGATVQIIGADGKVIGTAIAGPDGKWSFKLPSVSAGMGPFIVRVTGADGKAVDSVPLALNIAAAPAAAIRPTFLGPAAGANFAVGQPIDFTGTAAPGATVQIVGADGKVIGTAIAGPDGKWSFKLPAVSAGMGPFIVRVTGADGKAVDSAPLALNIAAAAAQAATVAPAAVAAPTATPSLLLGVTGGQPNNTPTTPLLIGVAGILALLAATLTRRRVR